MGGGSSRVDLQARHDRRHKSFDLHHSGQRARWQGQTRRRLAREQRLRRERRRRVTWGADQRRTGQRFATQQQHPTEWHERSPAETVQYNNASSALLLAVAAHMGVRGTREALAAWDLDYLTAEQEDEIDNLAVVTDEATFDAMAAEVERLSRSVGGDPEAMLAVARQIRDGLAVP